MEQHESVVASETTNDVITPTKKASRTLLVILWIAVALGGSSIAALWFISPVRDFVGSHFNNVSLTVDIVAALATLIALGYALVESRGAREESEATIRRLDASVETQNKIVAELQQQRAGAMRQDAHRLATDLIERITRIDMTADVVLFPQMFHGLAATVMVRPWVSEHLGSILENYSFLDKRIPVPSPLTRFIDKDYDIDSTWMSQLSEDYGRFADEQNTVAAEFVRHLNYWPDEQYRQEFIQHLKANGNVTISKWLSLTVEWQRQSEHNVLVRKYDPTVAALTPLLDEIQSAWHFQLRRYLPHDAFVGFWGHVEERTPSIDSLYEQVAFGPEDRAEFAEQVRELKEKQQKIHSKSLLPEWKTSQP